MTPDDPALKNFLDNVLTETIVGKPIGPNIGQYIETLFYASGLHQNYSYKGYSVDGATIKLNIIPKWIEPSVSVDTATSDTKMPTQSKIKCRKK